MASAQTLNAGGSFPEGTNVGAYPTSAWGAEGIVGAPTGSATDTKTVTNGQLAFTGLTNNTDYVAYAQVGGVDRYRRFSTREGTLASTGSGGFPVVGQDPRTLKYAPPVQVNPTVVTVGNGYHYATYGDNEDVILQMSATTVNTGGLTILGGRHIRIIGGKIAPTGGPAAVQATSMTGSLFMEGVEIDMTGQVTDAINAHGPAGGIFRPDVYLQNCRVTGVNGTQAGTHSDMYQPQGPIGRLYVDKFTGRGNYQGFFISPQSPMLEVYLSRVDLGYEPGGDATTYLYWFLDSGTQTPIPVFLDECYGTPRAGQNLKDHLTWPKAGLTQAGVPYGALTDDGGASVYWPAFTRVNGRVKLGPPAAGDFVPAGSVGLGYVTPGYRTQPSIPKAVPRVINAGNLGATFTLNCQDAPDVLVIGTLTANCVVTPINMAIGQAITFEVTQDGTGSRTLTFTPTALKPGGTGLALSTAAAAIDVVSVYSPDGTGLRALLTGKAMA